MKTTENMISISPSAGLGWAQTNINGTIFRHDPISSFGDRQVISYYDPDGRVILAERSRSATCGNDWQVHVTPYSGKISDAHNVISIMFDGSGRLHVSFDHHGHALHYAVAEQGTLELSELQPMLGRDEDRVTYPEFYPASNGDIFCFYRTGGSGNGDLVMNRLDHQSGSWHRVQDVLLAGEGNCNAYWQAHLDQSGTLHISWCWRIHSGADGNMNICYARSRDGGKTWQRSDGSPQPVPITQDNAEVLHDIPTGHDLINTGTMSADSSGMPLIATYWRPAGADRPCYMLLQQHKEGWQTEVVKPSSQDFWLGGGGSRAIAIARPLVVSRQGKIAYITRDLADGGRLRLAVRDEKGSAKDWVWHDLTEDTVGYLEPSFDQRSFTETGELHLYLQQTDQRDGEQAGSLKPQPVRVLTYRGLCS